MGSHHPIRKTVAPEPVAIPDKLYFRIGDVARLCSVPAYVLRFWETEFPSLKPNKGGTGQRLYRRKDVEMALRIKALLYDEGYTIPGARQVFKTEAKPREATSTDATGLTAELDSGPASGMAFPPTSSAALTPMSKGMGFSPPNGDPRGPVALAAPEGLAPEDAGEAIRRQARLRALRDELRVLLGQLGGPTTTQGQFAQAPSPVAASKPSRPRLVLEPKPDPKPEVKPALAAKPHLHLAQGDLFPAE